MTVTYPTEADEDPTPASPPPSKLLKSGRETLRRTPSCPALAVILSFLFQRSAPAPLPLPPRIYPAAGGWSTSVWFLASHRHLRTAVVGFEALSFFWVARIVATFISRQEQAKSMVKPKAGRVSDASDVRSCCITNHMKYFA